MLVPIVSVAACQSDAPSPSASNAIPRTVIVDATTPEMECESEHCRSNFGENARKVIGSHCAQPTVLGVRWSTLILRNGVTEEVSYCGEYGF